MILSNAVGLNKGLPCVMKIIHGIHGVTNCISSSIASVAETIYISMRLFPWFRKNYGHTVIHRGRFVEQLNSGGRL